MKEKINPEEDDELSIFKDVLEDVMDDEVQAIEHPSTGRIYNIFIKWDPEPGVRAKIRVKLDDKKETSPDERHESDTLNKIEENLSTSLHPDWAAGKWAYDNGFYLKAIDIESGGVLVYNCYPEDHLLTKGIDQSI